MRRSPSFGSLQQGDDPHGRGERSTTLLAAGGARVERIASLGHADPPGAWYDQAGDEFVLLVAGAARLEFADGHQQAMAAGDWAVLPAGCRHRVAWTDPAQLTLWLACHLPPA